MAARVINLALVLMVWRTAPLRAQDLALPPREAEEGFRRLIEMAQTSQLGADIVNANVELSAAALRVELVRANGDLVVLLLAPKATQQTTCRYFDITAGPGATTADVVRLGRAIDKAFPSDPFSSAGIEQLPGASEPIAGWADAWRRAGWRGLRTSFERRMMAHRTRRYTLIVTGLVAVALGAGCATLWLSVPPPDR